MPDTNNIITRIHFRSDLGENFDNVNDKIPEAGEPIVYMPSEEFGNHMQLKIGDGKTTLGALEFVGDDIRERVNDALSQINDKIEQIEDYIEETKSDVEDSYNNLLDDVTSIYDNIDNKFTEKVEELEESASDTLSSIQDLQKDLEPLATWPEGSSLEDATGVAGFVARANKDSVTLGSLVTWQGETNESIAGFRQEVQDNYATQESVTAVKTATEESISSVRTEVTNTYATKEDVSTFKTDTSNALTAVTEKVDANSANITSLTSWKSEATESITAIEQNVSDVESSINSLTSWQSDTNTAITNIQQKANDQESKITLLTDWKDSSEGGVESITQIKQQSDANKASIEQIAVWQDNTTKSIADFKTEVSKNYATQQMVSQVDENLSKFEQTVTDTYATTATVNAVGNALTLLESTVKDNYATNTSVATVEGKIGTAIAASEQKATETYASKSDLTSYATKDNLTQAVAGVMTEANGKFATSTDFVSFKTAQEESFAAFEKTAGETYATASQVASIVDADGTIKEAAIVTAVNNNISEINITAENINLEGQKLNIKVDATNIEGTLTIGQLPDTVAETDDIPTSEQLTTITNNTISTTNVTAQNLKVNAANIEGTLTIGKLPTTVAQKDDVPTESEIVTIAKGAITADYVKTLGLEVGNQITMGSNATIKWDKVENKPDVPTDEKITQITKNTITTENLTATNLHVNAANIDGTLTADKIDVDSLSTISANMGTVTAGKLMSEGASWTNDTDLTATGLTVNLDEDDPYIYGPGFRLDKNGMKMSGSVFAKTGYIGDFRIEQNRIYQPYLGHDEFFGMNDSLYLSTVNLNDLAMKHHTFLPDVSEASYLDWRVTVGSKFGVTSEGALYCNELHANNGYIGKWIIDSTTESIHSKVEYVDSYNTDISLNLDSITSIRHNFDHNYDYMSNECKLNDSGLSYSAKYWDGEVIGRASVSMSSTGGLLLYGSGTNRLNGGTWYLGSGSTQVTSDQRLKNSITDTSDKYSVFFDNLRSVTFKYNEGTSDRLHTGYIAQEVDEALNKAGLTRQDFAGLCIIDEGKETEEWSLRYAEFVPLNTFEIQKLKSRVAELEEQIKELTKH